MPKTTIVQHVDCNFAGDNHFIEININNDGSLGAVTRHCSVPEEEARGMFELGLDPNKTCYGVHSDFLFKTTDRKSIFEGEERISSELFSSRITSELARSVSYKRSERSNLKSALYRIKALEKESYIERGMRKHIYTSFNQAYHYKTAHAVSSYFRVKKIDRLRGKVGFVMNAPAGQLLFAVRKDGVWLVPKRWEDKIVYDFGRSCAFCGVEGHHNHSRTPKHKKTVEKMTFLALQATSGAGLSTPFGEIKYRKNSPNLLGVRFMDNEMWKYRYEI